MAGQVRRARLVKWDVDRVTGLWNVLEAEGNGFWPCRSNDVFAGVLAGDSAIHFQTLLGLSETDLGRQHVTGSGLWKAEEVDMKGTKAASVSERSRQSRCSKLYGCA